MDSPAPDGRRLGASLRSKLALLVTLMASVPLAVIGQLALQANADTLASTQRELQIALLEDLGNTIDGELADAEAGLDLIARVLADASIDGDDRLLLAKTGVEARISLDHAAVYDREGALIDVIAEVGTDTSDTTGTDTSTSTESGTDTTDTA
ncbi:MAG: hypothetical protein KC457_34510, partial [Myxococcales bacterium]|nr:hypothetical protein [Myxococcales bacterium]